MPHKPNHKINRLAVEFNYGNEHKQQQLQSILEEFVRAELPKIIESELEHFDSVNEIISIDKIQLTIENLDTSNPKQDFTNKFKKQLRKCLPDLKKSTATKNIKHSETEALLFYLKNGFVPWWSEQNLETDIDKQINKLLLSGKISSNIRQQLLALIQNPISNSRLVMHASASTRTKILKTLSTNTLYPQIHTLLFDSLKAETHIISAINSNWYQFIFRHLGSKSFNLNHLAAYLIELEQQYHVSFDQSLNHTGLLANFNKASANDRQLITIRNEYNNLKQQSLVSGKSEEKVSSLDSDHEKYNPENAMLYMVKSGKLPQALAYYSNIQLLTLLIESVDAENKHEIAQALLKNMQSRLLLSVLLSNEQLIQLLSKIIPNFYPTFSEVNRWMTQKAVATNFSGYEPIAFNEVFTSPLLSRVKHDHGKPQMFTSLATIALFAQCKKTGIDIATILTQMELSNNLAIPEGLNKSTLLKPIKLAANATKANSPNLKVAPTKKQLVDIKDLPIHFFETLLAFYFTYNTFPSWFMHSSWFKWFQPAPQQKLSKTESVMLYLLTSAHAAYASNIKELLTKVIVEKGLAMKIVYNYPTKITEQLLEIMVGTDSFTKLAQFIDAVKNSFGQNSNYIFFKTDLYKTLLLESKNDNINILTIRFFISFFQISLKQLTRFVRENNPDIFKQITVAELYTSETVIKTQLKEKTLTNNELTDLFKTFITKGFLPFNNYYIDKNNLQHLVFNYIKKLLDNKQQHINQWLTASQFHALLNTLDTSQLNQLAFNNRTEFTQEYIEKFVNELTTLIGDSNTSAPSFSSQTTILKTIISQLVFKTSEKLNQFEFTAQLLFNWLNSIHEAGKHKVISYFITQQKSSLIRNLFTQNWLEFHYHESASTTGKPSVLKESRTGKEMAFTFTEQNKLPATYKEQLLFAQIVQANAEPVEKVHTETGLKELNGILFLLKNKFFPWWASMSEISNFILSSNKTQFELYSNEHKQIQELLSDTALWFELNEAFPKTVFVKLLSILSIRNLDVCWEIALNHIDDIHKNNIELNTQILKYSNLSYLLHYAKHLKQISPAQFEIALVNYLAEQQPQFIEVGYKQLENQITYLELQQGFIQSALNDKRLKASNNLYAALNDLLLEFFNTKSHAIKKDELASWFTKNKKRVEAIIQKGKLTKNNLHELTQWLEADGVIQFIHAATEPGTNKWFHDQLQGLIAIKLRPLLTPLLKQKANTNAQTLINHIIGTAQPLFEEHGLKLKTQDFINDLQSDSAWKQFASNQKPSHAKGLVELVTELLLKNLVNNKVEDAVLGNTGIDNMPFTPKAQQISTTSKQANKANLSFTNERVKQHFNYLFKKIQLSRLEQTITLSSASEKELLKQSSIHDSSQEYETYLAFVKQQILLVSLPTELLLHDNHKIMKQTTEYETASKIYAVATDYLKELLAPQHIDPFNMHKAAEEHIIAEEQKETELTNDEQVKATVFALMHEIIILLRKQNTSLQHIVNTELSERIYSEFASKKTINLNRVVSKLLIYSSLLEDEVNSMQQALEQLLASIKSDTRLENALLSTLLQQNMSDIIVHMEHDAQLKTDSLKPFTEILNNEKENPIDKNIEQFYQEQLEWSSDIDANEKIYINNSGLVLLWPFLSRFFKNENLLENNKFKSIKETTKAINLLQFIATGHTNMPEFMLPLNKILCNIDVAFPIYTNIEISEEEKQRCNTFLTAVMKQWPSMKGTSIEGFRESFLQREGVLVKSGDNWNLKVEQKTIDALFITLSWGVSMIKLPWNKYLIFTEWN